MTDNEQSQLRFDISEIVRFHDELPGIDTLLSLDLTPEVRIEDLGANVRMEGVIRLSGTYLGQSDQTPEEQAEHLAEVSESDEDLLGESIHYVIPVEITLPAERVANLEDITAEIQSFDYELRSTHDLAIEALLVVDGLQLGSEGSTSQASFGEQEETEALIKGEDDPDKEDGELTADVPLSEYANQPIGKNEQQERLTKSQVIDHLSEATFAEQSHENNEREQHEEATSVHSDSYRDQLKMEHEVSEAKGQSSEPATEPAEAQTESTQSESTNDPKSQKIHEQAQTKIRFQPKVETKTSDAISLNEMLVKEDTETGEDAIQSLEHNRSYQQTDDRHAVDDYSDESTADDDSLDAQTSETTALSGIEWMKQHLGGTDEHFRRLRMVIVQKEDTLESIADRYELSSVELLQINKLESGELEQGQIVYLPDHTDSDRS